MTYQTLANDLKGIRGMYNHPKADHKAEFIDALKEKQPQVIHATENDDELLYLMMGSLGRLAELFKTGDLARKEVYDQCVGIAAAAMSIAIPIDEEVKPMPDNLKEALKQPASPIDDFEDMDEQPPMRVYQPPTNYRPTTFTQFDKKRAYDAAFFVYKHHSYGMTMKLEGWIRDNAPNFHMFKTCGVDRKDYVLIGLVDEAGAAMAFIRCPTPEVKNNCIDFLKASYPNRVDPALDSHTNYEE